MNIVLGLATNEGSAADLALNGYLGTFWFPSKLSLLDISIPVVLGRKPAGLSSFSRGGPREYRSVPVLDEVEERVRQTWAASRRRHSSILSRFVSEAERVGAAIRDAPDPQAVGFSIAALARAQGITLCQTGDADLVKELHLDSALTEAGIGLVAGPSPEAIVRAGIGVTRAVLGVAETGSILIHLDEVDARLLSMLSEIHVALLHQDAMVDSLEEGLLLSRYLILKSQARGQPSYLSWVTGPSRTADIERMLTIGVHGPRELHVFLLPPTGNAFLS